MGMFASSGHPSTGAHQLFSEGQWRAHLSLLQDKVETTFILAFLCYKKKYFAVAIQDGVRLSDIEIKKIQNLSLTAAIWDRATSLQLNVLDKHITVFVPLKHAPFKQS